MRLIDPIKKQVLMRTTRLRKTFGEWQDSKEGVAAIEFAFVAPAMLFMYFGLLEISMVVNADRKVSHATNVAGDLVTQSTTISQADMEDIMEATVAVMGVTPSTASAVTIEISSYEMLDDGSNTRQRVGYAIAGNPISKGGPATFDPAAIGNRLISINSGAVVARANYVHTPITTKFVKTMTLHETFMLKPRASQTVAFEEGASNHNTFNCAIQSDLTVSCTASTT